MTNQTILRKQSVLDKIKISSATLWRMCKEGNFPKPIQLGPNSVGWLEHEIEQWINDRSTDRKGVVK